MFARVRARFRSSSLWCKLLIPNLVVLVIAILSAMAGYNLVYRQAVTGVYEKNLLALNQSISVLNEKLDTVSQFCLTVSFDSNVRALMTADRPKIIRETQMLTNARDGLYPYAYNNNFIRYYGVYLKPSDVLVGDTFALMTGLKFFYGSRFQYNGLSVGQFETLLMGKYQHDQIYPSARAAIDDAQIDTLLWVHTLPYANRTKMEGAVFCCLNLEVLDALFRPIVNVEGGGLWIVNENGDVLYTLGSEGMPGVTRAEMVGRSGYLLRKGNGGEKLLTYVHADHNDWSYVAAVPERLLTEQTVQAQGTSWLILIASVALLAPFSLYTAWRNSIPLSRIIQRIGDHLGISATYIKGSYANANDRLTLLMDSRQQIENALREQIPLARAAFTHRLIQGRFDSADQMAQFMQYANVQLRGNLYAAIILWPIPKDPSDAPANALMRASANRATILSRIRAELPEACALELDNAHLLALVGIPQSDTADGLDGLRQQVERLYYDLVSNYDIETITAIGRPRRTIFELNQAYEEALIALYQQGEPEGSPVRVYTAQARLKSNYRYTLESETRLINLIKSGDSEILTDAMNALFQENAKLPGEMQALFLNDMRSTLIKLAESLADKSEQVSPILRRLIHPAAYSEIARTNLVTSALELSSQYRAVKDCRASRQVEDILVYLKENYTDPSLSLSRTAEVFGLTDVYLSLLFKEKAGENFTAHLEKLRIDHACALMRADASMQVEQLALHSGYNSADTFRKAFKRAMGVTPARYRVTS